MMINIRLVLEYDGSGFCGWQSQPDLRSIQGELERVLKMVLRRPISGICAAGRTDSGVHARGQVANFFVEVDDGSEIDTKRLEHSVSHLLKNEISVLSAEIVSADFNARSKAVAKQYRYRILNRGVPAVLEHGFAWHISGALDVEKICEQASLIVGEHDFTSFRGAGCEASTPRKTILESYFVRDGEILEYRVVGRGFLKQMVRNIVGTLVWIGLGKMGGRTIPEILDARDRRAAGVTAPAYGLYLDWVKY